jgi:DNA modification methylase
MNIRLINSDCKKAMLKMAAGCVGSIVCDPPYGLSFMGKAFDKLGEGAAQREWHEAWLVEAFRVLRPGGVIKAFGGTRTYHHLAAAMEEAGFTDIKVEAWAYGSGFPKSMNISKQLDKKAGVKLKIVGYKTHAPKGLRAAEDRTDVGAGSWGAEARESPITEPTSKDAVRFAGWGTALKPAWEPIVVGVKP